MRAGQLQLRETRQALVESLARVPGGTREGAEEAVKHLDVATFIDSDGEPDRVKIGSFVAQTDMTRPKAVNEMRADRLAGRGKDPRAGSMAEARAQALARIQERGGRR